MLYFTTVDLASGFHKVPLREEDHPTTAFSTPDGHFEFYSMPIGISSAPATFQSLMTNVLRGLPGTKALIYLDDTIVWGTSLKEHKETDKTYLIDLDYNNLKMIDTTSITPEK
jgi:hypothetical protein